jgi:hypothetical protein
LACYGVDVRRDCSDFQDTAQTYKPVMAGRLSSVARLGLLLLLPPTIVGAVIGWVAHRAALRESLDFEEDPGGVHSAHKDLRQH